MIQALAGLAAALVVGAAVTLVLLVVRRVWIGRSERGARTRERRVEPLVLALLDGDEPPPTDGLSRGDREAVGRLLMRYSPSVAGDATAAIAAWCEREGLVDRALTALRSRRAWRRAASAFTLGDMGSPLAGPSLLVALTDSRREVRMAAARSLGRLSVAAAAGPLARALADGRVPEAVAGQALVRLGHAAAPKLRPLLEDDDQRVRAAAAELLGLVGEATDARRLLPLVRDPAAEVRVQVCRALARVGAEDAVTELRVALDDRIPAVRAYAAEALGLSGDDTAAEALVDQAQGDLYEPAQAAARALMRVAPDALRLAGRDPDASPHLHEAIDLLVVKGT